MTTAADEITILGIGNTLMTDDGVGPHVIDALSDAAFSTPVNLIDGGTLSFTLAGYVEAARALIVIDAAQLRAPPGTVRLLEGPDMDAFVLNHPVSSVHEVSLADLFTIVQLSGQVPRQRALIAIQPGRIDWGTRLTAEVAAAGATACRMCLALIDRWGMQGVKSAPINANQDPTVGHPLPFTGRESR